ncbi:hypothetical protein NSU_3249 [Novosphingobium pentaromativorans US6-1]|uniref:Uncharacterized protein n=1 Tax=Novosphingobium pentaromativorans US6-1 TaxID=1088721 RepID=G6EFX7_9SPHN|nr:hypothetical protein NSU_3249 [Novosphingobium pentaromativorans US6-1]
MNSLDDWGHGFETSILRGIARACWKQKLPSLHTWHRALERLH